MIAHLVKIKEKVLFILMKYKATRDSDKILWLAYMVHFHGLKAALGDEAYEKLKSILLNENTPTFESITRVRRKFQEHDPDLAGEHREERLAEEREVREWARS